MMRAEAERHGVAFADVVAPGRRGERVTVARRAIANRLRLEGHSLPEIGRIMGGLHHTTVLYMLRRASAAPAHPTNTKEKTEMLTDLVAETDTWAI